MFSRLILLVYLCSEIYRGGCADVIDKGFFLSLFLLLWKHFFFPFLFFL